MFSPKTTVSAIALLLASAGAAPAFVATAVTDLNVRGGPGTNYGVVDVLQAGETVEVVGQAGGWYQLASGGWSSGNYLDPQGRQAVIVDRDYNYGPVAFYYDDTPYYWDDAGFYFYIDSGRRHRLGWDWFRRHDHRHFRWSDRRHRDRFDRHWARFGGGDWDGRRRGGRDDDDGRRFGGRDDDDGRRFGGRDDDDGRRFGGRDDDDRRFGEGGGQMQSGRASAIEAEGRVRGGAEINRGGGQVRGEGGLRARAGGQGGQGGPPRLEEDLPGGGY